MFTPHEQNVGQHQNTKMENYCFESVGELKYLEMTRKITCMWNLGAN